MHGHAVARHGRARNGVGRGTGYLDGVEQRGLVHHGLDGAHAAVRLLDSTSSEDLVAIERLDILDLLLPHRDLVCEHILEGLRRTRRCISAPSTAGPAYILRTSVATRALWQGAARPARRTGSDERWRTYFLPCEISTCAPGDHPLECLFPCGSPTRRTAIAPNFVCGSRRRDASNATHRALKGAKHAERLVRRQKTTRGGQVGTLAGRRRASIFLARSRKGGVGRFAD